MVIDIRGRGRNDGHILSHKLIEKQKIKAKCIQMTFKKTCLYQWLQDFVQRHKNAWNALKIRYM